MWFESGSSEVLFLVYLPPSLCPVRGRDALSLSALLHEGTEEAGFEGEATVFNKYVALRE